MRWFGTSSYQTCTRYVCCVVRKMVATHNTVCKAKCCWECFSSYCKKIVAGGLLLSQKSATYLQRAVVHPAWCALHFMLMWISSCCSKTWISIGDQSFQNRNLKPWNCVRERSVFRWADNGWVANGKGLAQIMLSSPYPDLMLMR